MIIADENLGYAGGNELALNSVLEIDDGTGLFWILNNDTVVLQDTLVALIEAYHQYGQALYGSVTVDGGLHKEDWRVNTRIWENNRSRELRSVPYKSRYVSTTPRVVEAVGGSSLLVPLAVVKQYGFIDPSFFMYCEDTDYCFKLRYMGIQNIEVPESVVIHAGGASHKSNSRSTLQPVITYYRARNKIVLQRKHFGTGAYIKAVATQSIFALGWLVLTFRRGIVGPRSACFTLLGIRDAIRGRMGKVYAPEDYLKK